MINADMLFHTSVAKNRKKLKEQETADKEKKTQQQNSIDFFSRQVDVQSSSRGSSFSDDGHSSNETHSKNMVP